jgi:hypothetical protein
MKELRPAFHLTPGAPWLLVWEGTLRPFVRSYRVEIWYSAIELQFAGIKRHTPHVEIVEPLLVGRACGVSREIPHIHSNLVNPARPRLCLYRNLEWTPADYIAETTVVAGDGKMACGWS